MTVTPNLTLKEIYENDNYLWLEETVNLLKSRRFNHLDIENLIEELEDMGKSERNAVESLLEQIIRHLLLYQYWTEEFERNGNHWHAEINSFRTQLKRKLTGTLKNHLAKEKDNLYQDALKFVQPKTNFKVNFPPECPYSLSQLLDLNYLPE